MSGGPQNFLKRVSKELSNFDLPLFDIVNPNPNQMHLFNKKNTLKVARMDGAIYYKVTSRNLFNLIKQRRENFTKIFSFLNYIPNNSTMFLNGMLNNYLNRYSRKLQKQSDMIIFQSKLSKKMQDTFVGDYYKNKPHTIILNGVPTDIFNPKIEKFSLDGFPKLVITASFRLHKRLQDAISITNKLKQKYPNIKLHILGNMDILTQSCINKLDLENCLFHGKLNSESLPNFYNSCDIGLSPSIYDPCPNSVVEMMACGLPVISVNESGASELLGCDDLVISENLELNYYELQTQSRLPKVNIQKWVYLIEKILDNRKYYSDIVLERIEKELDIKIVAKKYAKFIVENKNAFG